MPRFPNYSPAPKTAVRHMSAAGPGNTCQHFVHPCRPGLEKKRTKCNNHVASLSKASHEQPPMQHQGCNQLIPPLQVAATSYCANGAIEPRCRQCHVRVGGSGPR